MLRRQLSGKQSGLPLEIGRPAVAERRQVHQLPAQRGQFRRMPATQQPPVRFGARQSGQEPAMALAQPLGEFLPEPRPGGK